MQSIDINLLITQDQQREAISEDHSEKPSKISPIFKDITGDNIIIISNIDPHHTEIETTHFFTLVLDADNMMCIETKGKKSRTFDYDFQKQFLKIEDRRATDTDFKKLQDLCRKITLYLLKKPVLLLENAQKANYTAPTQVLASFFHDHNALPNIDGFYVDETGTSSLIRQYATRLQQFAKYLSPTEMTKPPSLLQKIKAKLLKALNSYNTLVITDSRLKRQAMNTVHSLIISKIKALYLEKSRQIRQRFEFIFKTIPPH